eukprot:1327227-Pyramimonas_sp.AAC.1
MSIARLFESKHVSRHLLSLRAVRPATLYYEIIKHDANSGITSSSLLVPRRRFPSSPNPRMPGARRR